MSTMTAAEREARKTMHGEWRTPTPITLIDDRERSDDSGRRFYIGKFRDNLRFVVLRREKIVGSDQVKIERHITLEKYGDHQDGTPNYNDLLFTIEGKVNMKFDRIKWNNGCCWCRAGATARDRDDIKNGRTHKVMVEDGKFRAAPPLLAAPKVFAPSARHTAAKPDWETQVAEVRKVMLQQLAEVDREVASRRLATDEVAGHSSLSHDRGAAPDRAQQGREQPPRRLLAEAAHHAPPPALKERGHQSVDPWVEVSIDDEAPPPALEEDAEANKPAKKVIVSEGVHSMFFKGCCAPCGSKFKVMEDDEGEPPVLAEGGAYNDEPLPEARDMDKEGFFSPDELDDIIDRINDVVGIWGLSEETEKAYIKPPAQAMNKLIHGAMSTFMSQPLLELLAYLMDDSLDFAVKSTAIGRYINEQFIQPLTHALVNALSENFKAFSWMKDQVQKVISMMSDMVTEQVVSKSVEQLNDCDAVD